MLTQGKVLIQNQVTKQEKVSCGDHLLPESPQIKLKLTIKNQLDKLLIYDNYMIIIYHFNKTVT